MKKVLLCANRDFVLYNFRFELIERLLAENYEVHISLPYGPKVDLMTEAGCIFEPIEINGRGTNPITDRKLISEYRKLLKRVQPDIILTYTTKVCIYVGILAGKMGIPYIENISGLGSAVEKKNILQPMMIMLYRKAVKKAKCVFFQNEANEEFFREKKIKCLKTVRIPGSGVNLERWKALDYPKDDTVHFLFIARIIKEKGIEEYLSAATAIKQKYPNTCFHVLGPCDGDYQTILDEKQKEGIIQYHGMIQDTGEYLQFAHCLIHPSFYPEGISNVLLEACSSARPIITTDRPGCREVIEDGVNGYMVPQRDSESLIKSVEKFLSLSLEEKAEMGRNARCKVEKEFDRRVVVDEYMKQL